MSVDSSGGGFKPLSQSLPCGGRERRDITLGQFLVLVISRNNYLGDLFIFISYYMFIFIYVSIRPLVSS